MKKILFLLLFTPIALTAQVGIGTNTPRGALEISSGPGNNLGFVLPQVSKVEDVINPTQQSMPPPEGTMVFDVSRLGVAVRIPGAWQVIDFRGFLNVVYDDPHIPPTYIKPFNTDGGDFFGESVSLSKDGNTLAVGAWGEASNATGIGGDFNNNSAPNSGAVYVFTRSGDTWEQQAYIKAFNTDAGDQFGFCVSLSADGKILAVGAPEEDSSKSTDPGSNSAENSGAVYLFTRDGTTWEQQDFIKASNAEAGDKFGTSVALSADGTMLAVGATHEASNATGIDGNQDDNSTRGAGAVYMFTDNGTTWKQQAYIKASNTGDSHNFGHSVSLSDDGNTLAVGAKGEGSDARSINGDQADNSLYLAGAVYVFLRSGATWEQQAYIKGSRTSFAHGFGHSVSLSKDGNTLAVGATSSVDPSYAYVFVRTGGDTWSEQAVLGALGDGDYRSDRTFGWSVSLSDDGHLLAVGSRAGGASPQIYKRNVVTGRWARHRSLKTRAAITSSGISSGQSVSLSGSGKTVGTGKYFDRSGATGINGDETDDSAGDAAGAAYVHEIGL